jgi:hypothetical protein
MLTIKVIQDGGREEIKEIKSAMLRPGCESYSGWPCITYFETGNESKAIDVFDGDVYIMNENGKTVADYCLGHPKNFETGKS